MPDPAPGRVASRLGRAGLLAAAGLALVAVGPLVLDQYSVNILVRSFLYGCIAVTVDILWGFTGVLSFGQSAFFAIGAYALGLASSQLGLSPSVATGALLGGLAVAGLVAALIGWLAFGYGVPPLYVSIVTLVLSIIFVQVIYAGGDFTGSSSGLSNFDTFDLSVEGWFRLAGASLVVVTLLGWVLVRSDLGRLLVSIRENEQRCAYFGVPTALVKTGLLIGSALVAALAGYAYAGYTDVIAPDLGNFEFGTQLVIWVALGGRGTLVGPAIAAVVIDFVSAYLSGSLPFVWQLVVGVVFIAVIVLMPQGLGPAAAALVRRLLPGRRAVAPGARLAPAPGAMVPMKAGDPVAAVEVAGVARRYGSLHVLEDITFTGRSGELVSLVGPNGAGKTTLIRCIADGHERSAGRVAIGGSDIGRRGPERCVRLGLGRKFQAPNVFDALTVAESLRIARARHERLSPWSRRRLGAAAGGGHAGRARDRSGQHARHPGAAPLPRCEAGIGVGDGAGHGTDRAAPRRTDGGADQGRARPGRRHPDRARARPRAVHPADRARPGVRARDQLAHRGAAPGTDRARRHGGGRRQLGAGADHLHRRAAGVGRGRVTPALEISGLVSGYGEAMVLRGVSLAVPAGEVLALLGKNGMGKSTLLKTVMGLLPVAAGRVRVHGEDTTGLPAYRLAVRAVAYSPQDQAIFQDLTVDENLRLGLASDRHYRRELDRVAAFFPFLGQRRRQRAGTLSGGEQKMLLVARALLSRPRLMLVDEITEGLQPSIVLRLAEVLRAEMRALDLSILLVEQNVRFALALADRYAVLARGEVMDEGAASEPGVEARVLDYLAV